MKDTEHIYSYLSIELLDRLVRCLGAHLSWSNQGRVLGGDCVLCVCNKYVQKLECLVVSYEEAVASLLYMC